MNNKRELIIELLLSFSFNPKFNGFYFLIDILENQRDVSNLDKIYNQLANERRVPKHSIERNIYYACTNSGLKQYGVKGSINLLMEKYKKIVEGE